MLSSTCFQSTRLVVYLALVIVHASLHKKIFSKWSFSMKNLKLNFWENFNENMISEILDLKYRTSYQPIKASVFKFLFILLSFNFRSFLVEIDQSIFINFDRFWKISLFLAKNENEWNFSTRKAKFLVLKSFEIFIKNITWFFVTLFQIDENLFELFLNQQRLVWNLKFFPNYKNSCFSVCILGRKKIFGPFLPTRKFPFKLVFVEFDV